jgi:lysophospholipase L1-like esterase
MSAPTAAGNRSPQTKPTYLALGDSIAFGYDPLRDFRNAAKFTGYPELLAQTLGLQLTNASCPGETSSGVISLKSQADPTLGKGCYSFRFQSHFPLHAAYNTSQLDFAVDFLRRHPGTQLVTIDIGDNDIFALYYVCRQNLDCVRGNLPAMLSRLADNLNTIYRRIRQDAHYQQRIVALTNYVQNYNDPAIVQTFTAVNRVIRQSTQAVGGYIADGFGTFAVASIPAGLNVCRTPLLIIRPDGCDVHPTSVGQRLLAEAIAAVLRGT